MSKYFFDGEGVQRDELLGGTGIAQTIWNINVGASAAIERGMLLGASSPTGEFSIVTGAADANKVLVIAAEDYIGGASGGVTQAYASGTFNAERIKHGGGSSLTIEPFINEMRKQNLHVTHLQESF